MTDLSTDQIQLLSRYRLPGLDLGDGFVYPLYNGRSILNIPSSICKIFGVPDLGAGPLDHEILSPFRDNIQRLILVLMDALSLHRFQDWMQKGMLPVWSELVEQGQLNALTSVTPSTTSSALTSLWTGRSPKEHGVTGYEMWLKEYGLVANTILYTPMSFQTGGIGSLKHAGFEPEKFIKFPTLGSHLWKHGVTTYILQHRSILRSDLSTILFKDADIQGFHTATDLWINLRNLIESRGQEKMFTWVYWSEVDHFGHLYGPDNERTAAEFGSFSHAMQTLFLSALKSKERKSTLLILTADHGQITTPTNGHYELRYHPRLLENLHIGPTGENRLAYLHLRPGRIEDAREYIKTTWPGSFDCIDSARAIDAGLFGPGAPHPDLLDRTGDMILAARQDAYLWWADKKNRMLGRHGGLSPEEMLVPFFCVRL